MTENEQLRLVLAEVLYELRRNVILYTEIDGPVIHKECRGYVADMIEYKLKERNIEIPNQFTLLDVK